MPAVSRPPATTRSPMLAKIMRSPFPSCRCAAQSSRSKAVALAVEHPLVTADGNGVPAGPWFTRHGRVPGDRVAESRLERPEVLGGIHDGVAREIVLNSRLLEH